ncbi:hypothetical protein Poly24_36060 [Rosistilla carotiformis]|uniref:Uncharacterized protein n=1 Tax=Rosistilla carotiformis TaxID=2528017 RepID=A0A518JWH1_9BACT|nr:hypothetical protein Poly24_36060 [Rosistilla carotiformis]
MAFLLQAACCLGQLSRGDSEYFADRIDGAAAQLDVAAVPSLEDFVVRTQTAIATVEQELGKGNDPANAAAWLGYLKLSELSEALAASAQWKQPPTSRDEAKRQMLAMAQLDKALGDMRLRLTINYPGLEKAQIPALRTAVRNLDAMLRHRDPARSIEYVRVQMRETAKALRDADETTAAEAFYQLDELTRLLIETGQAPLLVADLRGRFRHANLRVGIGGSLISRIATRPFNEPTAINECLLGTFVRGQATLRGTVTTTLLPSDGVAKIQLILNGDLTSQNRGYRKPVTVDALGYGHVTATKVLYLDDAGMRSEPAVASARLSSKIQRVNHPLKIVRKIAMKKAQEQKGAANAEGSRRLERRVAKNFDRQTDENEPLGDGKSTPVRDLMAVLGRLGVEEPSRLWSSESRYLLTTLRQQTDQDLAAAVPPPSVAGSHDLSIQIHESLINNVMTQILAGRTMSGTQLQQLGKSLMPELDFDNPETVGDDSEESEPPVITFSRTRPIIFEARDGKVWIGMRGTRFQQGDQSLKMPIRVRAEYLPTFVVGHGYVLQRQGDVEIDFPGTQRLSIGQIATRKKMERVFDRSLPKQLLDKPVRVPVKQLPESGIRVQEISAQQGWLSLGMR